MSATGIYSQQKSVGAPQNIQAIYVGSVNGRILKLTPGGSLVWSIQAHDQSINNMLFINGSLYFVGHNSSISGALKKVNTNSTIEWESFAPTDRTYGLALNGNGIFAGGNDNILRKYDHDGNLLATASQVNENRGILIDTEGIYTVSNADSLKRFDFDLNLIWEIPNLPGAYLISPNRKYFADNGDLFAGNQSGESLRINAQTGQEVWRRSYDNTGTLELHIDLSGNLFSKIHTAGTTANLRKLDSSDGTLLGTFSTPNSIWSMAADNEGACFIGVRDGTVRKIVFDPGVAESWSFPIGGNIPIVMYELGQLYAGDNNANFHRLDPQSGQSVWRYPVDSRVRDIVFEVA